jgi:hypothetical protein
MRQTRRIVVLLILLSAAALLGAGLFALRPRAGESADKDGWGEPVDGLAGRLVVRPKYVIGQAIAATIEVKNTSDKTRYIVPRLDPQAIEYLTLDIDGPKGKVAQTSYGKGYGLGVKSFEPIAAGEVRRFEVIDLRRYFAGLDGWSCYPQRKGHDVPTGKYTLRFKFHSPKVPDRFAVSQGVVDGKPVTNYEDSSKELRLGQWSGEASSAPVSFELRPLGKDDLVVHEWGVFTVFNDAKYANADRKQEWGGLPAFFYRQFPKERLRWVPAAWDKPVVYFYAKAAPLHLSVKVTFGDGAPVVWWPAVSDPTDDGGFRTSREPKAARPFRSLTWEAWLGDEVPANGVGPMGKATDFELPADCWLRQARLPDAARLTVVGNGEKPGGKRFPGALDRPETERFLYYDGLVPSPDYLRCEKVGERSLTLRNRAKFDLGSLFVVDRRIKGTTRCAVIGGKKEPFRAGTTRDVEPRAVDAAGWPAAGEKAVRQALLDAGLFAAEADALLKIWSRRLLEGDGVTAFHVLPAAEYDRMLPLDVLPAPATKPVRVGLAVHPRLEAEPDLAATAAALIRQLDDEEFEKRDAASKALRAIGPVAIGLLRAERKKTTSAEVRRRIEDVLDGIDAGDWLDLPPAKP